MTIQCCDVGVCEGFSYMEKMNLMENISMNFKTTSVLFNGQFKTSNLPTDFEVRTTHTQKAVTVIWVFCGSTTSERNVILIDSSELRICLPDQTTHGSIIIFVRLYYKVVSNVCYSSRQRVNLKIHR